MIDVKRAYMLLIVVVRFIRNASANLSIVSSPTYLFIRVFYVYSAALVHRYEKVPALVIC